MDSAHSDPRAECKSGSQRDQAGLAQGQTKRKSGAGVGRSEVMSLGPKQPNGAQTPQLLAMESCLSDMWMDSCRGVQTMACGPNLT